VVTLPDVLIWQVPLTWTAPLLTTVDAAINVPLTRSSVADDVLFMVKDADGLTTNVLAAWISACPEPVGAIVNAISFGLSKPILSIVWVVLPLISTALDVPDPELVMTPPVWVKLPFTFNVLFPDAPEEEKSNVPLETLTLPLTVIAGDPVPPAKTKVLVEPESEKLPATVIVGDVELVNCTSLLWVLVTVRLPLIVVRLPAKLRLAPGSAVRLMTTLPYEAFVGRVVAVVFISSVLELPKNSDPWKIVVAHAPVFWCLYVPPLSTKNDPDEPMVMA